MASAEVAAIVVKEKKPRASKGSKPPPSHPTYLQMITEAITSLKERMGSSHYAIAHYIDGKYKSHLPAELQLYFCDLSPFLKSKQAMGNCCGSCPPENASLADSIRLLIGAVDPIQQIDPLINYIENKQRSIKAALTEGSSSSGGNQVESSINLGAQIIEKLSTAAQALAKPEQAKARGSTALSAALKVIGETHWIFVGLSIAAYALKSYATARSNVEECRELLLTMAEVAKDLKKFREAMPEETEKLWKAFNVVAEGALLCCHYIRKGKTSRYWSATTMEDQLRKTRESVRDITLSLTLHSVLHITSNLSRRSEPSPRTLLGGLQPVGIEKQISDVKELLDMDGSDPAHVAVILCGFRGVGKTTLGASVIQNLLDWDSTDFKFCRVFIDENTPDKRSHILELQRNIILDFGGGNFDLRDPDDGRQQIQRVIQNKCCFLFIDNVVDSDYIKQLLPLHLLPANKNSKLRILITTRGSDLREVLNIQKCKEYRVKTLSTKAAQTLLRNIILQDGSKAHKRFDEAGLMNAVAKACRGCPLLLSFYGNRLKLERKEGSYHATIEELKKRDLDSFENQERVAKEPLELEEEDQKQESNNSVACFPCFPKRRKKAKRKIQLQQKS